MVKTQSLLQYLISIIINSTNPAMKRKTSAMQDKDLLAAIKLLRYGPSRRPRGNFRIMTYAAIGKALSISATTVRNLLKRSELQAQEEMN